MNIIYTLFIQYFFEVFHCFFSFASGSTTFATGRSLAEKSVGWRVGVANAHDQSGDHGHGAQAHSHQERNPRVLRAESRELVGQKTLFAAKDKQK